MTRALHLGQVQIVNDVCLTFKVAESLGLDEHTIVELIEAKDSLVITKKREVANLDDLLASIPEGFDYPSDVNDFIEGEPIGRELI